MTLQIAVVDAVPHRSLRLPDRRGLAYTGIVDEDINPAEIAYGPLHGLDNSLFVANIDRSSESLHRVLPGNALHFSFQLGAAHIHARDVHALSCQTFGDQKPQSARRAGDDCSFSLQVHATIPLRLITLMPFPAIQLE